MMKLGETVERLKKLEVELEGAEVGKQNAEADTILAKEMLEASKAEVKHIKMMVCISLYFIYFILNLMLKVKLILSAMLVTSIFYMSGHFY